MDYHVARDNQQLGVFSNEEVESRLASGEFLPSDLVWTEGMPQWQPAREVFAVASGTPGTEASPPPVPVPPPPPTSARPATTRTPRKPDNNLVWAILVCLCCCLPFGIVSIVYAAKVDSLYSAGNYDGAVKAAEDAKKWAIIGAVSGFIIQLIYVVVFVSSGGSL